MNYKTVSKESSCEMIRQKSRFIAYAAPSANEPEAIAFINKIKKLHPAASHNVYAYICRDQNSQRYSDDGEPSGTAGVPVLEVLKKEGLTDVCVVVTRYFGGTLLGAGGLVRAYGKAASQGIAEAVPVDMIFSDVFEIEADYSLLGKLQYEISENDYMLLSTGYGERVKLTVCTDVSRSSELYSRITEASFGKAAVKKTSALYVPRHSID
jgi:uncharacterized YigZ family protein